MPIAKPNRIFRPYTEPHRFHDLTYPFIQLRGNSPWFLAAESESFFSLYRLWDVVYEKQSEYQLIQLVDFEDFGRTLILDGRIQLAESDEHIYHEMLVHPAMVMAHDVRRVLILGGGDGCTLREVLKWKDVRSVRLVELDADMIDTFKNRFPELNDGAFEDPRVEVVTGDALSVLKDPDQWDVIISDLTEPYDDTGESGQLSQKLFTTAFFEEIRDKLPTGGIFAAQTGGTRFDFKDNSIGDYHAGIVRAIHESFPHVKTAYEYIPSFNSMWTTTFAGSQELRAPVENALMRNFLNLRYYSAETHLRLFTKPGRAL